MRFDIITIFPEFFGSASPSTGIFGHGVLKRGIVAGLVNVRVHDLRAYAHAKHRTVDDRPFGGGEGMVLKPEPLVEAVESLGLPPKGGRDRQQVVLLSAQGGRFTQTVARELSSLSRVVLLCGRYEGVDERVVHLVVDRELSLGDYVLSGGELAAAVVLDAVARLVPGVLGNAASSEFESFGPADALMPAPADGQPPSATHGAGGLLDYPHYTRPAEFRGLAVPDVLTNGNHEQVRRWRREQALMKTSRNRPDLIDQAKDAGLLSGEDRKLLQQLTPK